MLINQLENVLTIEKQGVMDEHELLIDVIVIALFTFIDLPTKLHQILLDETDVLTAEPLPQALFDWLYVFNRNFLYVFDICGLRHS